VISGLRRWAGALRIEVLALWLAARDPRVGLAAKWLAALVAAYALSPIDLIPDFIPVLGLLDDLLLVPLGIWLAIRLIDPAVMAELRLAANQLPRPSSRAGAIAVVSLWLAGLALFGWWLSKS
jgi:uncharacterized membrane protein YkvA (DUF1232 family)